MLWLLWDRKMAEYLVAREGGQPLPPPNCNMLNEDAAHLMVCPSVHRTTLFSNRLRILTLG